MERESSSAQHRAQALSVSPRLQAYLGKAATAGAATTAAASSQVDRAEDLPDDPSSSRGPGVDAGASVDVHDIYETDTESASEHEDAPQLESDEAEELRLFALEREDEEILARARRDENLEREKAERRAEAEESTLRGKDREGSVERGGEDERETAYDCDGDLVAARKRFRLLEVLGQGSYGTVWKAHDFLTGGLVAVKVMSLAGMTRQDLENVQREQDIHRELRSPYITRYIGSYWSDVDSQFWLVMEYMDAGSLRHLRKALPLDIPALALVCKQILFGLSFMHKMYRLHRDIKSDNILLSSRGSSACAKLADLGAAGELASTMDFRKTAVGTPYWMAPELVSEQKATVAADIWSFGITVVELVDGSPPLFRFNPLRALLLIGTGTAPVDFEHPDQVPAELRRFVGRCLVRDPTKRATAEELLLDPFILCAPEDDVLAQYIQRAQKRLGVKPKQPRQVIGMRARAITSDTIIPSKHVVCESFLNAIQPSPLYAVCHSCEDAARPLGCDPWECGFPLEESLPATIETLGEVYATLDTPLIKITQSSTRIDSLPRLLRDPELGVRFLGDTNTFLASELLEWCQEALNMEETKVSLFVDTLLQKGVISEAGSTETGDRVLQLSAPNDSTPVSVPQNDDWLGASPSRD